MDRKNELVALLKKSEPKPERKTYSLRIDKELFDRVELLTANGENLNTVLASLIEIGLLELGK